MHLIALLAWRFRADKRQNSFISFISASSTFGIGLGCCVLIVLLSVMNGFERELKDKLLSVIPHGEFNGVYPSGIEDWPTVLTSIKQHPKVVFAQPFVKSTGMLQKGNAMKAIELTGLSELHSEGDLLTSLVSQQHKQAFWADEQGLLLGKGVINKLGLDIGDRVQVLLPQVSKDLSLTRPKVLSLRLAGEINIGGELGQNIGYMHMSKAAKVQNIKHGAQGIMLRYQDPFQAPSLTRTIGYTLPVEVYMSNWTMSNGNLYQDIQLVRAVVYIALSLVIAVACFNIVSTLVMAVNEKQSEIAMLKSMGAKHHLIVMVFMLQGTFNGVIGTTVGVILGCLIAANLATLAQMVEQLLGVQFLSGDIYFIDFLPSELHWNEVYMTAIIALSLSVLSTLYPAFKAAKINPAKVLGH
jgi:lipoprotein-releasing system permease protein